MRDQISFQEDRLKSARDEISKLSNVHILRLEQEVSDLTYDLERLQAKLKENRYGVMELK